MEDETQDAYVEIAEFEMDGNRYWGMKFWLTDEPVPTGQGAKYQPAVNFTEETYHQIESKHQMYVDNLDGGEWIEIEGSDDEIENNYFDALEACNNDADSFARHYGLASYVWLDDDVEGEPELVRSEWTP